jgi:hypothetical protein
MEKPMRHVQPQFVFKRCAKRSRLASRRFRAYHDFTMLKRDDVCGTFFIKKGLVQFGHPPVGHQHNAHFVELRKHFFFPSRKLEARRQNAAGELLKRAGVDLNLPLPVTHNDLNHTRLLGCLRHITAAAIPTGNSA